MGIKGLVRNWVSASVQIPAASSLSGSLVIAGRPIVSIGMPASWDGASLTFDVSAGPGETFFPLYDDENIEVSMAFTACTNVAALSKIDKLSGWYGMRIRSGSGVDDPDDQEGARTFRIFLQG